MTQFTLPGFDTPLNVLNGGFLPTRGSVRDRRALQSIAMAPAELRDELALLGGSADEALDILGAGDVKGMRARMAASEIMQGGGLTGMGGRGGMGVQVLDAIEDLAQKDLHPRLLEAGFTPRDIPEGIGREQMNDIMREIDGGTKADKDKALKALEKIKKSLAGSEFKSPGIPNERTPGIRKAHQDLIEASGLATGEEARKLGRATVIQIADDFGVKNFGVNPGMPTSALSPEIGLDAQGRRVMQNVGVGTGAETMPAALRRSANPRAGTVALSSMENAADMPLFRQAAQQQRAGRVAADAAAGRPVGPMPMGRTFAPNILPVEGAGEAGGLAQIEARTPRVGVGRPLTAAQRAEGLVAGSVNPAAMGARQGAALASLDPRILAQQGAPMGAPPPLAGAAGAAQTDDVALALAGEMQQGERIGGSRPNKKTGKTPDVSRADKQRAQALQRRITEIKNFKPTKAQAASLGLPDSAVGKAIFADTPDDAVLRIARASVDQDDAVAATAARSRGQRALGGTSRTPREIVLNQVPGTNQFVPPGDAADVGGAGGGGRGGGGAGGAGEGAAGGGGKGPKPTGPGLGKAPKSSFFKQLKSPVGRKALADAARAGLGRAVTSMGGGLGIAGLGLGFAFLVSDAVSRRNQRAQEIQGLQLGLANDARARMAPLMQLQGARQGASELRGLAALAQAPRQVTQQEAELASLLGRSGAYAAQQSAVAPQGTMMAQQRVGGMI